MTNATEFLSKNRLVEEVPGVPADEQFFIWSGAERRTVWTGATAQAGREWAAANDFTIELFEPFEP